MSLRRLIGVLRIATLAVALMGAHVAHAALAPETPAARHHHHHHGDGDAAAEARHVHGSVLCCFLPIAGFVTAAPAARPERAAPAEARGVTPLSPGPPSPPPRGA